jgi:hypothetical protein
MQGDWAVEDMMRGRGQRTQCCREGQQHVKRGRSENMRRVACNGVPLSMTDLMTDNLIPLLILC